MARGRDPLAKRKDETDLQWRSRVARTQETRRKQGEDIVTPERLAKGDLEGTGAKSGQIRSYRQRSTSSLARLCVRGVITNDQLAAAEEIAIFSEQIGNDVSASSASYNRVDCGSSGRDYGSEPLRRICIEQAYNRWRLALPLPRQMVLDMVKEDNKLAAIAASYHRSWRKAIVVLKDALDAWPHFKREAFDTITQDDVDEVNRRVA